MQQEQDKSVASTLERIAQTLARIAQVLRAYRRKLKEEECNEQGG